MKDSWDKLREINEALRDYFVCVPPYQCVTGSKIDKLHEQIKTPENMLLMIQGMVNNPGQRTYQMEYRFKKCEILLPYMPVLEYATYDILNGNWICSYLSLLPVIEASLRKWAELEPTLTFEGMKKFTSQLSAHMKEQKVFEDEREAWSDSHIEYLQYALSILFERFNKYQEQEFSSIFNRNLTLHKLDGVMDIREGTRNCTRAMLILDIIAELYLMQDVQNYWNIVFNADPESNPNFQLRWALYKKWATFIIGPNDLLFIPNALSKGCNEIDKMDLAKMIDAERERLVKFERYRGGRQTKSCDGGKR